MKPLGDRVVVRPLERSEKSKGGIYLPETASKDRPTEGELVAVGTGKLNKNGERVASELKAGDRVIFSEYGGTEIKVEGEKLVILRSEDVLAVCN